MRIEPGVGPGRKGTVEPSRGYSRFVAGDQQDRRPPRVEGKGHTPCAVESPEPEFLHVGMTRAFERVDRRPTELRAEQAKSAGLRQQFETNRLRQLAKLRHELPRIRRSIG